MWQRKEQPLPCPIHGHPGWLAEDNQIVWELYEAVIGTLITQCYQRGEQTITKSFLNPVVVQVVFDWWEIPREDRQAFWQRLQRFHEVLNG